MGNKVYKLGATVAAVSELALAVFIFPFEVLRQKLMRANIYCVSKLRRF